MKSGWWALAFLLVAASAAAQEPQITPDMAVDSATLEKWVHSDDPRLIAWAADFARRNPDPKILAELPGLLDQWSIPFEPDPDGYPASRTRTALAILDALIQTNTPVPIQTIGVIASAFPAQAAFLISRHPLSESRVTLDDWILESPGTYRNPLPRIASMMIAVDPKGSRSLSRGSLDFISFVAGVVADSEAHVSVTVKSRNAPESGTGRVVCGDRIGHPIPSGWPEAYWYGLAENDLRPSSMIIADLDGDRIVAGRSSADRGGGSCTGDGTGEAVELLDSVTRHRLIAHWLGVADADMAWQPVRSVTIIWAGKADYARRLGEIVEAQREKLRATVKSLQERGFLSDSEAATVMPRLSVTVKCEIEPCPLDVH